MTENNFNTYEFIINEDDEIMLLLYSQNGSPEEPTLEISPDDNKAVLYRSKNNGIVIEDIPDDILEALFDIDNILICELSIENNDDDTKITNAYEAKINIV